MIMTSRKCLTDILRLPLPLLIVIATIAVGIGAGMDSHALITTINDGWGQRLGEFAVILLPSFTLAEALSRSNLNTSGLGSVLLGPVTAAGMVCPDTAYAALSPMGGDRRFALALGAYAGFKLLFPAGPLLVATALGVATDSALLLGGAIFVPVWLTGLLWSSRFNGASRDSSTHAEATSLTGFPVAMGSLTLLLALVLAGVVVDLRAHPVLGFLTQPAGALATSATLALTVLPRPARRECLERAVGRTTELLFLIGAGSALGRILVELDALDRFTSVSAGMEGILGLFALTAAFKLIQGSSIATFAAVASFAAPFTESGVLPPPAAVLAVCAGSMVAILPNDSFYWLIRQDAFGKHCERSALVAIVGGSIVQGVTALASLYALWLSGALS